MRCWEGGRDLLDKRIVRAQGTEVIGSGLWKGRSMGANIVVDMKGNHHVRVRCFAYVLTDY